MQGCAYCQAAAYASHAMSAPARAMVTSIAHCSHTDCCARCSLLLSNGICDVGGTVSCTLEKQRYGTLGHGMRSQSLQSAPATRLEDCLAELPGEFRA